MSSVMVAVLVGVLVVLVAAIALGVAVFGRTPVPQPATGSPPATEASVTAPSKRGSSDSGSVTIPTAVRVRSGLLLLLASVAIAGFVGVVGSVLVVGLGLLIG